MQRPLTAIPTLSVWSDIEDWLDDSGPDILVTIAALAIAYFIFRRVFPPIARAAMIRGAHPADAEIERRADTIVAVIVRTAAIVFIIVGTVTVLAEFGVNITAIVTGLGIAGLAIALGTQTLVKDAINGIFLLAEDQYRRGDYIKIADVAGTVEDITLRRTIIRDQDGVVHSVPNGSINVVSNYTRDYAQVNVPVRVAYGEDLSRVESVVNRVGKDLANSPEFSDSIVDMPRVWAVESVGDGAVTVTVTARARPAARWEIAGELRRRLAEAFVTDGIRVPFAQVEPEDVEQKGAGPSPEKKDQLL
jgi:moderate conductance mechanosensitive channel